MDTIGEWFRRRLLDPQMLILIIVLIIGGVVVFVLGGILGPVLVSVVIAYLLQGLVNILERWGLSRLLSVILVFLVFLAFLFFLLLGLLPLLWQQVDQFFQKVPAMISWSQEQLIRLPERFPDFITEEQVTALIKGLRSEVSSVGQKVLSISIASVRAVVWILVYFVLVPILVFFLLKDKERLLGWVTGFLPSDRRLASEVWSEMNQQIANFLRGKAWEILIVWGATYLVFSLLDLDFAVLLSLFVGLSVLVPYIGAIVMTLPVASIAYFQWGLGPEFAYVVGAYLLIQLLDGNLLAPLLFSEVVNLHPVAIIVSVLLFGGLFGFWGVFFAIPLATLVQAVIKAWIRSGKSGVTS